jgi:hypothetical protein
VVCVKVLLSDLGGTHTAHSSYSTEVALRSKDGANVDSLVASIITSIVLRLRKGVGLEADTNDGANVCRTRMAGLFTGLEFEL